MKKQINFESKFRETKGQPFMYKGMKLQLSDKFSLKEKKQKLKIIFEKANSKYIQGIHIYLNGYVEINNKKYKKEIVLLENTVLNKEMEILVNSSKKEFIVWNMWVGKDHQGREVKQSCNNGAAMIVEELDNNKGKRYKCNDGYPDDDFDDIIFRIEYMV